MKKGRWFTEKCLSWPKYTSSPLCCWLLLSAPVTGSLKRCFFPFFPSFLTTPTVCTLLHNNQWRHESILGAIVEEGMWNMSCPHSAGAVQGESYCRHFTPEEEGHSTEPLTHLFSARSRHWSWRWNGYETKGLKEVWLTFPPQSSWVSSLLPSQQITSCCQHHLPSFTWRTERIKTRSLLFFFFLHVTSRDQLQDKRDVQTHWQQKTEDTYKNSFFHNSTFWLR